MWRGDCIVWFATFFGLVWFAGDSCRGTCTGVVYANAKTLSIQFFRDILSVFALLLSTRTQFRFPCSRSMSFYFESVCLPSLVYMCGRTSGEASNGAWYCGVYDFAFRDLEIRAGPLTKEVCVHDAKHASAWSCRRPSCSACARLLAQRIAYYIVRTACLQHVYKQLRLKNAIPCAATPKRYLPASPSYRQVIQLKH